MITGAEPIPLAGDQSFFDHPKRLFFSASRRTGSASFSTGMTALLVLYMVSQLLLPGMSGRLPVLPLSSR